MKLYSMPLSNYSAKTRIVIYEKGIDVEIAEPPGGLDSEEYEEINPLGQIPTLEVNGTRLPESEVINEYLEDRFSEPALLPESPLERAQTRLLSRFHDLYVQPLAGNVLYEHFYEDSPDPEVVQTNLESLHKKLDKLENFLIQGPWIAGETFTLADAAFVPTTYHLKHLFPEFGVEFDLEGHAPLAVWWDHVQDRDSCQTVVEEMDEARKTRLG